MESERDMYRQFQDWCLRTYGDSGKTKTVTRKKYERIVQLLNGSESSSTDNAKFKFWVKSKGFQLGQPDEVRGGGGGAKQVLYVPVKTTVSESPSSVICLPEQPGGEGRERGASGGPVRRRWFVCPHPPQPPPQPSPLALARRVFPTVESLWSFILKRQCISRAGRPPCLPAPGPAGMLELPSPARAASGVASSGWAIVPCPSSSAWRMSHHCHRA
ncbi:PREDICTED: uncharacterized protein LOC103600880 [Galeopterus variegatus]|uniref:Uncharacterized protein LOC103600880 n=1 Tax=Galeopterus variegatus TaxID=482537 RepID=A0ABM0RS43_GALVR|nr:PREDICTED: uncharacterized protein LOC103600880 [Galeopterus variegatus]